jgi:uncharacterized membrane protein YfcA
MTDSPFFFIIIFIVCSILFGIITASMADKRGMKNGFWWGFCFSIIGVLIVSMQKRKKRKKRKNPKLAILKEAKGKLDLQLITQQEYDVIKEQYKEQTNQ